MTTVRALCFWLLGVALVSAGVLERGYVLCRGGDGEARVEAAAGNGRCELTTVEASGCSSPGEAHQPGHECGGCEDVALSSGTVSSSVVRASFSPDAPVLSVVPQAFTWILRTLLPAHQWLPSTPRLMPVNTALSPAIAQVRETVILVI